MNESATMEILEKVLRPADAEAVTATLEGDTSDYVRFANNVITQNARRTDLSLSLSCAYGQRHASASTNDLSEGSLKDLVQRTQAAARISPPDPEYMPPVEAGESGKYLPVDAYFEKTIAFDPETRAKAISKTIDLVESKGFRLSGALNSTGGYFALANSAGLRAYHRSTGAELHTTVLANDGSGWAQSNSNDVDDIDPEETVAEALSIAMDSQGPTDMKPGKYTVILRPAAVEEMIPHSMICDAKATDEGRTFLRGKLGKKICGKEITIRSDPSEARCPGSPFHWDGFALPKISWVEKGVLTNLMTSRYWAKKTGRTPTGYPSNVIMEGGSATLNEMIASTERGILVTRFWYLGLVDPMKCLLTGMTRDGLFLIENGNIVRPIKHLRFNESVPEVLNRIEAMGPPERVGRSLVPTLKIRDFNFTSTTKF